MPDDYELGNVRGQIEFDLPDRELKKLDVAEKSMKKLDGMTRNFETKKSLGGLFKGGDFNFKGNAAMNAQMEAMTNASKKFGKKMPGMSLELPTAEKKKIDSVAKKAPVLEKTFKAFSKGGAAIAAAFGTVALLFGAGNGFRAFFGALGDMLGVLSDLLFMQVWPLLKPLLEWMVDGLKKVAELLKDPGAALTMLANPETWSNIGSNMLGVVDKITDPSIWKPVGDVFKGALDGILAFTSDPESWKKLGEIAGRVIKGLFNFVVEILSDPKRWKAFFDSIFNLIGTTIKVVGGFLLDPNTWIGLAKVLWAFVSGFLDSVGGVVTKIASAGWDIAVNFAKGVADKVGDLIDAARKMAQAFVDAVANFFMNNPVTRAVMNAGSATSDFIGNTGQGFNNARDNAWGGVTSAWNYVTG